MKIMMPAKYRKYFTVGDLDEIKRIKEEEALENDIGLALEVAAAGGEILKVKAEWTYNHAEPADTYYGNGVDVSFTIYVLHEYQKFVIVNATLKELICKSFKEQYAGYGQVYKFSESYKEEKYR